MSRVLSVCCPSCGDRDVFLADVVVDYERHTIAFTCPRCHDLVLRALPERALSLLKGLAKKGEKAAGGHLGPVVRDEVCGGSPMRQHEADLFLADLEIDGALELCLDRWRGL